MTAIRIETMTGFLIIICEICLLEQQKNILNALSQAFLWINDYLSRLEGGGPMVVVSASAFHARVRGSFPGLGDLKETKMFLPHPLVNSVLWGASMTEM